MGALSADKDVDMTWLDNSLSEDIRDLVEGYLLRDTYKSSEPDLDDINNWLSGYDDIEENWGRPDKVKLRMRMSKVRDVGLKYDNTYMALDLSSPYVVFMPPEVKDDEYYIIRTDKESNKSGMATGGLPEASIIGSVGQNFLERTRY